MKDLKYQLTDEMCTVFDRRQITVKNPVSEPRSASKKKNPYPNVNISYSMIQSNVLLIGRHKMD